MKLLMALLLGVVLAVWPAPGSAESSRGEVRSPSGKLLFKTTTHGDRTEVRDASGKLVEVHKKVGDSIEVRSPSGKLLYKIKDR